MTAKKSPSKKPAPPKITAPPEWSGPFYNQFSCLVSNTSEVPANEYPILPEAIVGCLQNLAAYEHFADNKEFVAGPSEWAMQYLSRVLREEPQAMLAAMKAQVGEAGEQADQEAMCVARRIVVTTATVDADKVSYISPKDLFKAMKVCHPSLYARIPEKKRAQSYWLTRAKLKFLPQKKRQKKSNVEVSPQEAALTKMILAGRYPMEVPMRRAPSDKVDRPKK